VFAGWELVDHTADVMVRAFGASREEVFEQAALATVSLIYDASAVRASIDRELSALYAFVPSNDDDLQPADVVRLVAAGKLQRRSGHRGDDGAHQVMDPGRPPLATTGRRSRQSQKG